MINMKDFEGDETYSVIFLALKHGGRRKILRMLSEGPRTFTELLDALKISSSNLTYHLDSLGELISKEEDGRYRLSAFGEAAVTMMTQVEDTPKRTNRSPLSSITTKWKVLFLASIVLNLALSGALITQYRVLDTQSKNYNEQRDLLDLTKIPDVAIQTQCTLRYISSYSMETGTGFFSGPFTATIYIPKENSTLQIEAYFWGIHPQPDFVFHLSLQKGEAFDPSNKEAQVVWGYNLTRLGTYRVQIPSEGWHTLSILGPIQVSDNAFTFRLPSISNDERDLNFSFNIRILIEGESVPFALNQDSLVR
jgi:DNA-binding transcriptional ArsR family regulator